MKEGNMTLVNDIGRIQLAIQEAIRSAFKSPEVMKMFAKRENGALRSRLASIQQDYRLGKISSEEYLMMSAEIIGALDKLGEILEPHERSLLENYTNNKAAYIAATSDIASSVMTTAASQANQAMNR
eukprot:CAMPEP_0174818312 /NCGR_PEP_ID=MMETSP1107-20130205/974_1 /TAXON_ID=36770 /ORGANISM="Paraphysomonas vestita, Strain GFlagA" /LENGTH=126 /DNA_ID=CAMNT_0016029991 /DNA_START=223 /DNA_END=603 /DNA_ORIENTATION=-